MSFSDWDEYTEEQLLADAEAEYLAHIPTDLHEEAIRSYLGSYGDAIDARIEKLLTAANYLRANSHPGPSVAISATALEVMIRYFCVRPIVEAAFLSDFIAREVAKQITESRWFPERDLLGGILEPWGIKLNELLLSNGKPLWSEFKSVVLKNRNNFVHRGEDVSDEVADIAFKCATDFRAQVVMAIANRLGFTHGKTHCWSKVITDSKEQIFLDGKPLNGETVYETRSPFV